MVSSEREAKDNEAVPTNPDAPVNVASSVESSYRVNKFGETVSYLLSADSKAEVDSGDAAPSEEIEVPEKIGRYQVRRLLGKGAFGAVFLGFDQQLDRQVAIKVPQLHRVNEDTETRFLQEARQVAKLSHPGIVAIYDVGVEDGRCYIVTDFLEGRNLNEWLVEHRPNWVESAKIVADIADALAHAHAMSTVHRDVKPENIIMVQRPEGLRPVLVDFGLALSAGASSEKHRGLIAGTPN